MLNNIKRLLKGSNILIIIIVIAAILRLWKLGSIPPSLNPDEAALGYNAYSILKTGKDEYGKVLPVIFKSFGDYKPGLYIYLDVPFIATLGLNEFATRVPSALSGVLIVFLIFLIVKKLFPEHKLLPVISSFIAATNPWLIYFSRGAWEVNVCLMLTLLGIYFFLISLEKSKFLILSAVFFSLTLVCYQGAKLSSGIVVLILLGIYLKKIIRFPFKHILIAVLSGLVISLPVIISVIHGQAGRLEVFNVFSYPRPKDSLQTFLNQGSEKVGDLSYYLFHSESFNFLTGIAGRYFNHFSARFLFFEGDFANPRHSAPNAGMFLFSDMVLLVVGIFIFVKRKFTKSTLFILLLLILSPLPSALSRDQVHAARSINLVIPLIVIISFGLNGLLECINKFKFRNVLYLFSSGIYLLSLIYFADAYFVHLPKHNSELWNYGYKQIVETVTPIQAQYKVIKVQRSFDQPYIYFLFYQKYDPAKYQKNVSWIPSDSPFDVGYVTKLDNIQFSPIDWSLNRGDSGTLFVADIIKMPPQDSSDPKLFNVIKEIRYLNTLGTIAFRIVAVK